MNSNQGQSQRNVLPNVLAIVSLCGLLAFASLVVWALNTRRNTTIPPKQGYGHPEQLMSLSGRWSRYRLAEVPVEIELPAPPKMARPDRDDKAGKFIQAWATYSVDAGSRRGVLFFSWYRDPKTIRFEGIEKNLTNRYREYYKRNNFNCTWRASTIGTLEGSEMAASTVQQGRTFQIRLFLWRSGETCNYLFWTYPDEDSEAGKSDFNRIIRSMKRG